MIDQANNAPVDLEDKYSKLMKQIDKKNHQKPPESEQEAREREIDNQNDQLKSLYE
eukprot:CAMPEP_0176389034 /NCGR_PEP_ID=MMETSP0126-20121128/38054_1 /TAXON_ID=141414 ORGANISM="Strombidinopsis acuminatum, Strain SPMC142" /NCGR_SAMPLE_ID=MMETSP0126 /ASSEMBLY_ACC=CAM_ASM_000229 /LENGTH=55 /DNA_ID=CAMNT_0017757607 /DNA_START=20 /DNA_END=187 /DNA_ORIENTATION=+